MVTMSMPLFEADYDRSLAQEHAREAESYEYQREQRIIDLQRDRKKAADMLDSLKSQTGDLTTDNVYRKWRMPRTSPIKVTKPEKNSTDVEDGLHSSF